MFIIINTLNQFNLSAPINNGTKKLPNPPTIPGMLIILVYIIINIYIYTEIKDYIFIFTL